MSGEDSFEGSPNIERAVEAEGSPGFEKRDERKARKEQKEREHPKPQSQVKEILVSIRERPTDGRGKTPTSIKDGFNLVNAELTDSENGVEIDEDGERITPEKLEGIRATLDKLQTEDSFTYEQLAPVLNYLQDKRNTMYDRFEKSFGQSEEMEQNGKIYDRILHSVYDAIPYTAEAVLPEYPRYIPTERPLKPLVEKAKVGQIALNDAKSFYETTKEDVVEAVNNAKADTPAWREQTEVMAEVDAYIHSNEDEIYPNDGTTHAPLVVTVKDGRTEVKPYQPQKNSSLKDDLKTDDGSRKFIFNPDRKGADMRYLSDHMQLYMWKTHATNAVPGIEELMREKPVLTKSQKNGLILLLSLFQNSVDKGKIPTTYEPAMKQLRTLVGEKVNSAELVDDPNPEGDSQTAEPASA
jgi:hypothetical protein